MNKENIIMREKSVKNYKFSVAVMLILFYILVIPMSVSAESESEDEMYEKALTEYWAYSTGETAYYNGSGVRYGSAEEEASEEEVVMEGGFWFGWDEEEDYEDDSQDDWSDDDFKDFVNLFLDLMIVLFLVYLASWILQFRAVNRFFKKILGRRCSHCGYVFYFFRVRKHNDKLYCRDCTMRLFKVCESCNKIVDRVGRFRGRKVCDDCKEKYTVTCSICNKTRAKWEMRNGYCGDCRDAMSRSFRSVHLRQKFLKSTSFLANPSRRFCGVELECRNRNRDRNSFITRELNKYNFSQVRDSSINGGGVEFVSSAINGDRLFNNVETFCDVIKGKSYFVDKSCGFHAHFKVPLQVGYLKKLYIFYEKYEKYLFMMQPRSRQETSYCEKFDSIYHHSGDRVVDIANLNDFKRMIYETTSLGSISIESRRKYNDKKYCWANFHSVFYRGTLEIRNHAGTINKEKIVNWLKLHLTILDLLKRIELKDIYELEKSEESFLRLFDNNLQTYIKKRWDTFRGNNNEESD